MSVKLNGKVAVISGGSGGIGRAIAMRLHAQNVKVYNISKSPGDTEIFEKSYQCDISDDENLKKAIADIIALEGKIDFLFCNAGFGIGGKVENASLNAIDSILNVNLIAHIKTANLFAKNIKEGGKIIFTGSLASVIPLPYQACYSATKAGIESFSRALATELKPRKIKVITVMPGDIKSGFTSARIKEVGNEASEKHGIMKMEKAENKGKSPDFVAKKVLKIIKKKRPPLRVSIGFSSKFLTFILRLLPIKLINYLVEKIYI